MKRLASCKAAHDTGLAQEPQSAGEPDHGQQCGGPEQRLEEAACSRRGVGLQGGVSTPGWNVHRASNIDLR